MQTGPPTGYKNSQPALLYYLSLLTPFLWILQDILLITRPRIIPSCGISGSAGRIVSGDAFLHLGEVALCAGQSTS